MKNSRTWKTRLMAGALALCCTGLAFGGLAAATSKTTSKSTTAKSTTSKSTTSKATTPKTTTSEKASTAQKEEKAATDTKAIKGEKTSFQYAKKKVNVQMTSYEVKKDVARAEFGFSTLQLTDVMDKDNSVKLSFTAKAVTADGKTIDSKEAGILGHYGTSGNLQVDGVYILFDARDKNISKISLIPEGKTITDAVTFDVKTGAIVK